MKSRGAARALDRQPRHGAAGQARRPADPGPAQGGRAGLSALRHASSCKGGGSLADALAKRDGVWGAVVEEVGAAAHEHGAGRSREGGRRRPSSCAASSPASPTAALNAFASLGPRLMIPLEAVSAIGPGAARQPAELGISPAPAAGRLRRRRHRRASRPLSRRRLAGAGARRGGRRHPLLARPADPVHRAWSGLSSLLVGGVGVGNAISSFLAGRLRTIATLKCLGAPERLVFSTYFLQLARAGAARRGDRRW